MPILEEQAKKAMRTLVGEEKGDDDREGDGDEAEEEEEDVGEEEEDICVAFLVYVIG